MASGVLPEPPRVDPPTAMTTAPSRQWRGRSTRMALAQVREANRAKGPPGCPRSSRLAIQARTSMAPEAIRPTARRYPGTHDPPGPDGARPPPARVRPTEDRALSRPLRAQAPAHVGVPARILARRGPALLPDTRRASVSRGGARGRRVADRGHAPRELRRVPAGSPLLR